MASVTYIGSSKVKKIYVGTTKIKKVRVGATVVYTAGNIVTYHVDTGVSYKEEVDADSSVLSPQTFKPSKSGWEFVGWRQDSAANGGVLQGLTMGDDPITLYAVFRQNVTLTYYNPSAHSTSQYRYYNNSAIANPKFTVSPESISGWTFSGWTTILAFNAPIAYSAINNTEIAESITVYQSFRKTVTLTVYNGSRTASKYPGTAYGTNISLYPDMPKFAYPMFTIAQASLSGWTARGWSTSTAGNGGITYASLNSTTISSDITLYGMYQQTVTLTVYNYTSVTKPTGTRYYNSGSGSTVNATIAVPAQAGISGWTARGYSTSSAGNGGINYNAGSNTFAANTTIYGLYQQTITLSYSGNGNSSGAVAAQSGTRYYSSAGTYVNPSFTVRANGFAKTGYSFVRWRLNSTSGAAYAPNSTVTLSANSTMYAEWTYVGSPYYLVKGGKGVTALTWTKFDWNNMDNGERIDWRVGGDCALGGSLVDKTKNGNIWYRTSIPTKGNHTLSFINGTVVGGLAFKINGSFREGLTTGVQYSYDVSNLSSVTVEVRCSTYAYNHCNWYPTDIWCH